MDGLVAELGCGGSALHAGPQQLRLQLNDPLFERLAFHSSGRRRDRDDHTYFISSDEDEPES